MQLSRMCACHVHYLAESGRTTAILLVNQEESELESEGGIMGQEENYSDKQMRGGLTAGFGYGERKPSVRI